MDFVRGAAEAGDNVGNLLEGNLLSSPNFQRGSGMTSILTVEDPSLFFKIWQNRCPRLQS